MRVQVLIQENPHKKRVFLLYPDIDMQRDVIVLLLPSFRLIKSQKQDVILDLGHVQLSFSHYFSLTIKWVISVLGRGNARI